MIRLTKGGSRGVGGIIQRLLSFDYSVILRTLHLADAAVKHLRVEA